MANWFDSLVQIRLSSGDKGSGLFISPTEVLTAAHVVAANGQSSDLAELTLDIRFLSRLATPRRVSVLATWTATQTTSSDVALLEVDAEADLGVVPLFGVPPAHVNAFLEGHGFEAQNDSVQKVSGNVQLRPPTPEEPFLFSGDFTPLPGMSGGPLVTVVDGVVRVAGLLTRRSDSQFIGLSLLESVLTSLRTNL